MIDILLKYSNGWTFRIQVPESSITNGAACMLDSVGTTVEWRKE